MSEEPVLPHELRHHVAAVATAILPVLAWPDPVQRVTALAQVQLAAIGAVCQATRELPLQLAEMAISSGGPA